MPSTRPRSTQRGSQLLGAALVAAREIARTREDPRVVLHVVVLAESRHAALEVIHVEWPGGRDQREARTSAEVALCKLSRCGRHGQSEPATRIGQRAARIKPS